VMGRIVKDEAAHGVWGFTFLDWAMDRLTDADKAKLGGFADLTIRWLYNQWRITKATARKDRAPKHDGDVLGWMKTDEYLALAAKSMQSQVIGPLEARGIPIAALLTESGL